MCILRTPAVVSGLVLALLVAVLRADKDNAVTRDERTLREASIDTDGPGFKKIMLKPQPDVGLKFAKTSYDSVRGTIGSEWKTEGQTFTVKFTVPPNTTATAYVLSGDPSQVTESGKPAREAQGVQFLWSEDGFAVYRLTSGTYEFVSKL